MGDDDVRQRAGGPSTCSGTRAANWRQEEFQGSDGVAAAGGGGEDPPAFPVSGGRGRARAAQDVFESAAADEGTCSAWPSRCVARGVMEPQEAPADDTDERERHTHGADPDGRVLGWAPVVLVMSRKSERRCPHVS